MSTLSYQRRTKGTSAEVANVYKSEEIYQYFKDDSEWRLASRIYWERYALRRHVTYFLDKYKITVTYFNDLMRRYALFMLHKYTPKS